MGWTNNSNPANGGSAISIAFNQDQSYLIQNHNPQGNIGDICKYITDMGWVPGSMEGRKWRMPTHLEYMNLNDYARSISGFFPYQQSTDRFGQAVYSNGYRPGEALSYWTSSPRVNNGDALDYIQIQPADKVSDAKPTNTQGFQRNTGSTIRCVLENSK